MMRTLTVLAFLLLPGLTGADGPPEFKTLKYRLIGPHAGGRVSRACGVPGDPLTYYAATASGGVWKSSNGGVSWKPVFDDQPTASIGSIAVAPSDPNVVYVGSGEANIRGNVAAGNGIYKSTDAGKTWKHVWKQEGQIGTMIVHPANPDVAYAAVLGHAFGPNGERGVYRTTDGGKTWQQVLARDRDTGASDVCLDPTNPRILFAGLWQTRRRPWEMTSGGPGGGVYVSRDGGDTWKRLGGHGMTKEDLKGLPEGIYGKVCVAVAPSDGRRVYAMIEAENGGLYRSDDGGETWKLANGQKAIRQRPWYFSTITVDPKNPEVIWFPQVPLLKSIDGGKTLQRVKGPHHGDHHDIWIDPLNTRRVVSSNDGGVDISTDGGETWFAPPLPLGQFYHIACDNRTPYHVSGTMQDLGTASGPSNSLTAEGIQLGHWHPVGGGEAGHTAHDPTDHNIVYASEYGGYLSKYDHRTRQPRNISVYPFNQSGHGAEAFRYRFQWTAPILVSPHDPKTVYHAGNKLFRTTDGGQSWTPISGDLTRNDRQRQKWSGGPITGDNTGVEVYGTIFAIAESPKQKDLLWAGSDDGLVHVSRDSGKTWDKVSDAMEGFPEWGTICCIEPSPDDPAAAYVVADAHRLDDMRPYLWKTTDFGKTWKGLSATLPNDVYLHVVRADPKKKGLLFVGTERGVSFSTDDGATWKPLKLNLPTVAAHDLVVKNDDLVVGTHGRSIWILDDLTPLREHKADAVAESLHLLPARPAIRWHNYYSLDFREPAGANPPNGALIHYTLKEKPKGDLMLEILDAQGGVIRRLTSKEEPEDPVDVGAYSDPPEKPKPLPTEPGLHRVVWDLRYEGAELIPGAKLDAGNPKVGPRVNPGTYTVRLTADGKSATTKLEILLDPRQKTTPAPIASADMEQQLKLTLQVRDDLTRLTKLVTTLRSVRGQLADRNTLLRDNPKAEELRKLGQGLIGKLDALEAKLHNPKAQTTYDILAQKGGAQLYSQLGQIYANLVEGDGAPTQGVRELLAEHAKLLAQGEAELRALLEGDLGKVNALAKQLEVANVIVPGLPAPAGKR